MTSQIEWFNLSERKGSLLYKKSVCVPHGTSCWHGAPPLPSHQWSCAQPLPSQEGRGSVYIWYLTINEIWKNFTTFFTPQISRFFSEKELLFLWENAVSSMRKSRSFSQGPKTPCFYTPRAGVGIRKIFTTYGCSIYARNYTQPLPGSSCAPFMR